MRAVSRLSIKGGVNGLEAWATGRARHGDVARLIRFAIVGVAVALIYFVVFLALRRSFGLAEAPSSLIAFGAAVFVQYIAQTIWTFRNSLIVTGQIAKFVATIALGAAASTAITGGIGPSLGLQDEISAAIVVLWLPVQNFALFSLWVYRGDEDDIAAGSKKG